MAGPKTLPTRQSVERFLQRIPEDQKRQDAFALLDIMKQVTKTEPQMWGSSIVGFGSFHYKYASGREGDMPLVGFSPRKQNLTLYIRGGLESYAALLAKLGKHTTGKGCLYLKRLDEVHLPTLKKLIQQSFKHIARASE